MKCEEVELSAYFDNELSPAEAESVRQHVDECPACTAELSQYRRVREALSDHAAPATLHAHVMPHAEPAIPLSRFGDGRPRFTILTALACAAVVAVLAGLSWMRLSTLPGPEMKAAQRPPKAAATPRTDANDRMDKQSAGDQTPAPIDTPSAGANARADLALELSGTILGEAPQAVLKVGEDGTPRTYQEGDELASGVRLAKIQQRRVIVDDHGCERVLDMASTDTSELPNVTGIWRVYFDESDSNLRLRLTQAGHLLEGTFEFHDPLETRRVDDSPLRGTLSGRKAVLEPHSDSAMGTVEGEFSESFDEFSGEDVTVIRQAEGAPPEELYSRKVRMTRIAEDELRSEVDFQARLAARFEELQGVADALRRFAVTHDDRFPTALGELVPDYVGDAALIQSTEERRFEYHGGVFRNGVRIAEIQRRLRARPLWREALLGIEGDLREVWGGNTPSAKPVLIARYSDPEQWLYVDGAGKVQVPADYAKPAHAPPPAKIEGAPDEVSAMIESDQNNLKQLGIVLKMFQGEVDGFLPGGWLTTYPEYLTDPEVLRSPWDPHGVMSYDLLFPAWHGDELLALLRELADSEAIEVRAYVSEPDIVARPRLEGLIPVVIGKRAAPARPGEQARRHVLFLDGHVEALLPDSWEIQVAPFLR